MKNFTFKTEKPTGRYCSFQSDNHFVKLNKVVVGKIIDKIPFKIKLMVVKKDILEDGEPNCNWKWITFKHESKSLKEAKEFLKTNYELITKNYKLITE